MRSSTFYRDSTFWEGSRELPKSKRCYHHITSQVYFFFTKEFRMLVRVAVPVVRFAPRGRWVRHFAVTLFGVVGAKRKALDPVPSPYSRRNDPTPYPLFQRQAAHWRVKQVGKGEGGKRVVHLSRAPRDSFSYLQPQIGWPGLIWFCCRTVSPVEKRGIPSRVTTAGATTRRCRKKSRNVAITERLL